MLDAAATLTAVVTVDGELAHWEGAWRPDAAIVARARSRGRALRRPRGAVAGRRSGAAAGRGRAQRGAGDGELRSVLVDGSGRRRAGSVVATGVDAAERERIERDLRELVDRDALTGLLDRRRFEEELERHVAQGRRYGMGGALIVLDLDGFRSVNDDHGPRAGDRVLVAVAKALGNRLRDTDLLARIGGDQFAVLLPRAKPPEAERVCQALEEAIPEEVHAPGDRRSRPASASRPSRRR